MTNRQSNIIFYSIISIIVCALATNYIAPDFFDNLNKSKEERLIKKSIKSGEHNRALTVYHTLVEERIASNNENTAETAVMYESMADLYRLLGNKNQEKTYYLKSLSIKEQLEKSVISGFAKTYDKLGSIAEEEENYDQAQMYYEKSLSKKLGNTKENNDDGLLMGYQHDRERYFRLNNESTIATFKKLAAVHTTKNEFDTAKDYYEKALAASKLTFGEDDSRTLEVMRLISQLTN